MEEKKAVVGNDIRISARVLYRSDGKIKPFPFVDKGVTQALFRIGGNVISSDSVDFKFDNDGGFDVFIRQSEVSLPIGAYDTELMVKYADYPNGRTLIHPDIEESNLRIRIVGQVK